MSKLGIILEALSAYFIAVAPGVPIHQGFL